MRGTLDGRTTTVGDADGIRDTVDGFLAFFRHASAAPDEDLLTLLDYLDQLSIHGRHVSYEFEDGHAEPPRLDGTEALRSAAERFPGLAPYNIPDPVEGSPGSATILVADPYDDIADLRSDLEEVAWCFRNTSENDALWRFQFGYQYHWGDHLSNLRWYLMRHLAGWDAV